MPDFAALILADMPIIFYGSPVFVRCGVGRGSILKHPTVIVQEDLMRLLRRARVKLIVLMLAGGTLFQLVQNCAIFATQEFQQALNYTWFLTCETATLFSGDGILVDCEGSTSSTTTGTSTTSSTLGGLSSLLSGLI